MVSITVGQLIVIILNGVSSVFLSLFPLAIFTLAFAM
jgi:hypothetical protein